MNNLIKPHEEFVEFVNLFMKSMNKNRCRDKITIAVISINPILAIAHNTLFLAMSLRVTIAYL
jgi:hypothetical protein